MRYLEEETRDVPLLDAFTRGERRSLRPPDAMMHSRLPTYALRRLVNQILQSTEDSPSLAEMIKEHLEVDWSRQKASPYYALYAVHNHHERFIEISVFDARGYPDQVYLKGQALLRIGVNGSLANPEDEAFASATFGQRRFRSCPVCHRGFDNWLDYYGHTHLAHWGRSSVG